MHQIVSWLHTDLLEELSVSQTPYLGTCTGGGLWTNGGMESERRSGGWREKRNGNENVRWSKGKE